MTKKNIINSIRNYNIKGYSKLKKSDLINHIMKPIHRPFHKLILRNLNKTTIDKKKKVVKIPKEHKKHHTKKHIEVMKKEMKKGKSFKKAHDIAVKEDKKEDKKKDNSLLTKFKQLGDDISTARFSSTKIPNIKDLKKFIERYNNLLIQYRTKIKEGDNTLSSNSDFITKTIPSKLRIYQKDMKNTQEGQKEMAQDKKKKQEKKKKKEEKKKKNISKIFTRSKKKY